VWKGDKNLKISMCSKLATPLAAALLAGGLWGASLGSDDTSFVKSAAKGNMTEVELGRLAVQKGASPDVKAFGEKMIRDHSKANRELATLASSKGVELPTSKSIGEDVSVAHLKMLSGKSFDDAYVKMMVDDHKDDVTAFQKASDNSQDPDVKHFATKTLPTLQSHLTKIEQLQSNMMSSK
jgi:putative membrane protein